MRHSLCRLEQHETLSRLRTIESSAGQIVYERSIVVHRIVATQGQLEAVLSSLRPVAGSLITTDFTQNRIHLANKVHGHHIGR